MGEIKYFFLSSFNDRVQIDLTLFEHINNQIYDQYITWNSILLKIVSFEDRVKFMLRA